MCTKKHQALALAVAEYHLHMHKMNELRPETVLKMLEKTRSINDDNRALQVAQCCTADAKGRTGLEDIDYPQADLFLRYQKAVKKVDASKISEGMGDGAKIQMAIKKARISAIAALKKQL